MTDRKFYRTVITTIVLSKQPFVWDDLIDVDVAIENGEVVKIELDSKEDIIEVGVVLNLVDSLDDLEYFGVDEDGNDIKEDI
jgi:hypothetical protein